MEVNGTAAAAFAVSARKYVVKSHAQTDHAALLAVQRNAINQEKKLVPLQSIDEPHDGSIVAAQAGLHVHFHQALLRFAVRVLATGQQHIIFHRQRTQFRQDF